MEAQPFDDIAKAFYRRLEVWKMRTLLPDETWQDIDRFIREVPEAREKLAWVQEVIADAAAEGEERGRSRALLKERRETLIWALRFKFRDVPEGMVRTIEATDDPDLLRTWRDRLQGAGTLEDVGIPTE